MLAQRAAPESPRWTRAVRRPPRLYALGEAIRKFRMMRTIGMCSSHARSKGFLPPPFETKVEKRIRTVWGASGCPPWVKQEGESSIGMCSSQVRGGRAAILLSIV